MAGTMVQLKCPYGLSTCANQWLGYEVSENFYNVSSWYSVIIILVVLFSVLWYLIMGLICTFLNHNDT